MFVDTPPLAEVSNERLEAEIESLAATLTASTARWVALIGEYDARNGWWSAWGVKTCADWVSWRCGLAPGAAREHVRVARALRELPKTQAGFEAGELSFSKVRALTRVADAESEAALIEIARHATAAQLERMVGAYRRVTAGEAQATHENQYLYANWEPDGSLRMNGRLDAEAGALFMRALDSAKETLFREFTQMGESHVSAETPPGTADALSLVADTFLAHEPAERSGGDRVQVVVHIDADDHAHLEDGPALAPETAERLACDASVVKITERNGEPLSVGRKTRTVPPAIRRALKSRDQGCRYPGCNSRRWVDAHHIKHWRHGGETAVDNLVLLCRRHHRLLHEGGYTVEPAEDGLLTFRHHRGYKLQPSPAPPTVGPDARLPKADSQVWTGTGEPAKLGDCVDAVIAAKRARRNSIGPMRSVQIAEDRALVPTEKPEPVAAPGGAVVDVARCGICGSDLHLRPSASIPVGTVMGHEVSGSITALGPDVDGWSEGERVTVYPFVPCGECPMCTSGAEHVCMQAATTGIGLGAVDGAYAERIAVDASSLFRLPDDVSDDAGALVEPFAVGIHGVAVAEADPAQPALVIGAGPIGVMTALALRARGFERVLVVERNELRAQRVRDLGFDAFGLDNVHMAVLEACGGLPPPAIFECAGNPAALGLALELVRTRGVIVALGVLEEPVPISQLVLLIKEAQIRGSFAYTKQDFADAIELIASGALPVEELVTSVVELERAEEMFAALLDPAATELKVLLAP